MFAEAGQYLNAGDYSPAIEILERAHRLDPASSQIVRSPTFAGMTKPPCRAPLGRWKNYQKYFEPHLPKLAPLLRAFGYE